MGIETAAIIGSGLLGGYFANEQAKKAADAQDSASQKATQSAREQADIAQQAQNKANQKQPDLTSMLAANKLSAKGGNMGTLLTSPLGAQSPLQLGKNTLLGG